MSNAEITLTPEQSEPEVPRGYVRATKPDNYHGNRSELERWIL
jgi:hypothetical protein